MDQPDISARVRLTINVGDVKPGDIDFNYRTVATVTVHPSTMTPDQEHAVVSLGGTVGRKVTRTYTDGTSDESSTHCNTTIFR